MADTIGHLLDSGGDVPDLVRDRERLQVALERVKAHRAARPDRIDRRAINRRSGNTRMASARSCSMKSSAHESRD